MAGEEKEYLRVDTGFPIGKKIDLDNHLKVEGKINKVKRKYGIIRSRERYVEERGRIYLEMEAVYWDRGKIKKGKTRIDLTGIVRDIKEAEEVRAVLMIYDLKGTVLFLSDEFDRNVLDWSKEEKLKRGQYRLRDEIVGRYNITSYMRGKEKALMNRIMQEVMEKGPVVRGISVPPDMYEVLQCKNKDMTHVINIYFRIGDNIAQISINLSKISNKKWREMEYLNSKRRTLNIKRGDEATIERFIEQVAKKKITPIIKDTTQKLLYLLGVNLYEEEKEINVIDEGEYFKKYGEEYKDKIDYNSIESNTALQNIGEGIMPDEFKGGGTSITRELKIESSNRNSINETNEINVREEVNVKKAIIESHRSIRNDVQFNGNRINNNINNTKISSKNIEITIKEIVEKKEETIREMNYVSNDPYRVTEKEEMIENNRYIRDDNREKIRVEEGINDTTHSKLVEITEFKEGTYIRNVLKSEEINSIEEKPSHKVNDKRLDEISGKTIRINDIKIEGPEISEDTNKLLEEKTIIDVNVGKDNLRVVENQNENEVKQRVIGINEIWEIKKEQNIESFKNRVEVREEEMNVDEFIDELTKESFVENIKNSFEGEKIRRIVEKIEKEDIKGREIRVVEEVINELPYEKTGEFIDSLSKRIEKGNLREEIKVIEKIKEKVKSMDMVVKTYASIEECEKMREVFLE